MTVPSEDYKSGPYLGNGVTSVFPYDFKISNAAHIKVTRTVSGVDSTVDPSEYTVSGVGSEDGGDVVLSTPPPGGHYITNTRDVPFTQNIDLENQGAYLAEVVEQGFDLAVMRDQQLQEQLDRAVTIPIGAGSSELDNVIANVTRLAESADQIDTVAGIAGDVATVADLSSVIAAIPGEVDDAQDAAAAAIANNLACDKRYLGSKSSAPSVDNQGAPLAVGALYFSTSTNAMQIWTGSAWVAAYVSGSTYALLTGAEFTGDVIISKNVPVLWMRNTAAPTDSKLWFYSVNGSTLIGYIANDANNSSVDWLRVARTGVNIDSVSFPNGNIGIGTATPTARLHVETSGSALTALLNRTGAYSGTDIAGNIVIAYAGNSIVSINAVRDGADDAGAFTIGTQPAGGVVTERVRVTSAGDVGIGTTAPAYKLDVAGTIRSSTGGFCFPDGTVQTTAAVTATGFVPIDAGSNGVGIPVLKYIALGSCNAGATIAGSSLRDAYFDSSGVLTFSGTPAGTWKNVGGANLASNTTGSFQRIAL